MADQVVWSTPAMCMVPASRTVREGKYITTAGRVKFDVGQSGRITFFAAVASPLPEGEYVLRAHLERTIPDRFGTTIALRSARHAGGAVSTLLSCVGVQRDPVKNNVRFTDSDRKKLAIDLDTYYYWVQVDDNQATPVTTETVKATVGVSLIRLT
jgi:hypothetical protein